MDGLRRRLAQISRGDVTGRATGRLLRTLPAPADGLLRTSLVPGSPYAEVLDPPDLHAVRQAGLDLVLASLGGARPVLTPPQARTPWRLAIREEDAPAALAALRALPRSWSRTVGPSGRLLLRPHHVSGGRPLPAVADLAVEVHVLRREDGVYTGRDRGVVSRIQADDWELRSQESLRAPARRAGPPQPAGPIDVVYTWVDGEDPAWRERRDRALRDRGPVAGHPAATDPSRYLDSQELRYSMRSVRAHASWVRRIVLVTDGQVPAWLDPSHPAVRIVDHRDLLGGSRFNSHALEAALHRIPDLSERYLYLNDDVFLGRIVHPGDFFANDHVARFFPARLPVDPGPAGPGDEPVMAAARNGRDLLREAVGAEIGTRIAHAVHPQLRSVHEEMDRRFPEALDRTRASAFRSPEDVSAATFLHPWYAWATDRAVPTEPSFLYVDLGSPRALQQMDALLSLRRYDMFCLNQESLSEASERGRAHLARMLPAYFPDAAPWERDTVP